MSQLSLDLEPPEQPARSAPGLSLEARRATLPPVTFYEATLVDGGAVLIRIDRSQYPAFAWGGLFEIMGDKSIPTNEFFYLIEANFQVAIAYALPAWSGMTWEEFKTRVGTVRRTMCFARLCRALSGGWRFSDGDLSRAGIARLLPLIIQTTEEWSHYSEWSERGCVGDDNSCGLARAYRRCS